MKKASRAFTRFALLLLALLLASVYCLPAWAEDDEAPDHPSLVIRYLDGETPIIGAHFKLHRVADIAEDGTMTLTEQFAVYQVQLDHSSESAWAETARLLNSYASRDGLEPAAEAAIGEDGEADFNALQPGLYLIDSTRVDYGHVIYSTEPMLFAHRRTGDEEFVYLHLLEPKFAKTSPDEAEVERRVLKVWDDDGAEDRPEEITAQLLRDGEVYAAVVLGEHNQWHYAWEDLNAAYDWTVVEKEVPDGYTLKVERTGVTFVMTNTKTPPDEPPPDEPPPDNPPPDNPPPDNPPPDNPPPDNPPPDNPPPDNPPPDEPTLPQTGMLWWPVPAMAAAGLILLTVGIRRRRRDV